MQRALVAHAAVELAEPEPTTVLGMDEVRFGRVRWLPEGVGADGATRWRRMDPWETGFVDLAGDQAWLAQRSSEFRDRTATVVIDPHAGHAAAVRLALPDARIAVDHFHLIMLGNRAVTAVRQRVTRDLLGRREDKTDPVWANRRLLLQRTGTPLRPRVGADAETAMGLLQLVRRRYLRADHTRRDHRNLVARGRGVSARKVSRCLDQSATPQTS